MGWAYVGTRQRAWVSRVRAKFSSYRLPSRVPLTLSIRLFSGNFELPKYLPIFGKTQLQVLSALCAILLLATNLATVYAVQERPRTKPPQHHLDIRAALGVFSTLKDIWTNFRILPHAITQIVSCPDIPMTLLDVLLNTV